MSFRKDKGEAGRVSYLKLTDLIFVLVSAGISAGMFIAGLAVHHTRANLLTVVSVLLLLPACKKLTNLIVILPFKDTKKEDLERIAGAVEKAGQDSGHRPVCFADMLFSTEQHILKFGHVTVTENKVLFFSEMSGKLNEYATQYFRDSFNKRGFEYTFALFTSPGEYAAALKRISVKGEADAGLVGYLHSLMI